VKESFESGVKGRGSDVIDGESKGVDCDEVNQNLCVYVSHSTLLRS